jgi:hypothetical protein
VLAILATLAVLRVAPGGSAPPAPSAARRNGGVARSGREGKCADPVLLHNTNSDERPVSVDTATAVRISGD